MITTSATSQIWEKELDFPFMRSVLPFADRNLWLHVNKQMDDFLINSINKASGMKVGILCQCGSLSLDDFHGPSLEDSRPFNSHFLFPLWICSLNYDLNFHHSVLVISSLGINCKS
jgi:hypothetical protein